MREGVYTLPVLHALGGPRGSELREVLQEGPPSGERLDRALEIVRAPEHLARARSAVVAEVDRAHGLAERFPDGPARTALGQLAEFLAARCGARGSGGSRSERGRASGNPQGKQS
jgi:geranylgeranyl pyrophosphate synthase